MKRLTRKILATNEEREFLAIHFRASLATVKNACLFRGGSILLRRIRAYAVNNMDCAIYDNKDLYLQPL